LNQTVVKQRNDIALRSVIDTIMATLVDSLGSVVVQPIIATPAGEITCVDRDEWLESISNSRVVVRGQLGGPHEGHSLHIVFDIVDAITLSDHMMLTSDEVVDADRDALTFEQEHHESFAEVSNIVCSGINTMMRREVGPREGLRVSEFATIRPNYDPSQVLGRGAALVCDFNLRIGNYPETQIVVVIDHEVAQAWNGETPLFVFGDDLTSSDEMAHEGLGATGTIAEKSRRTTLSTFTTSPELAALIQKCGQVLDLKIQRHARTDIPNPAAHRDEIVLIEIPVGEEKRFEWARRLKQYHRDLPLALLIHEPSRPRVVQGLLTRANVILAWPSGESQLLAKLEPLIEIHSTEDDS
jgi:hypothetical protein